MTNIEREMEDQLTTEMAERLAPAIDYDASIPPRRPFACVEADTQEEAHAIIDRIHDTPTVGVKHDTGKAPVWQGVVANFPLAMLQIAHVSKWGQTKHPTFQDWQNVPDGLNRYRDALGRHMLEIAAGETFDVESRLMHAAHFAWNALAVLELELRAAANVK